MLQKLERVLERDKLILVQSEKYAAETRMKESWNMEASLKKTKQNKRELKRVGMWKHALGKKKYKRE